MTDALATARARLAAFPDLEGFAVSRADLCALLEAASRENLHKRWMEAAVADLERGVLPPSDDLRWLQAALSTIRAVESLRDGREPHP